MASRLRRLGVRLFAVGIDGRIDRVELRAIATNPDDTHFYYVRLPTMVAGLTSRISTDLCNDLRRKAQRVALPLYYFICMPTCSINISICYSMLHFILIYFFLRYYHRPIFVSDNSQVLTSFSLKLVSWTVPFRDVSRISKMEVFITRSWQQ